MSDLIFVSTEQFKKLQEEGVGQYIVDTVGAECIILNDCIIKIFDQPSV